MRTFEFLCTYSTNRRDVITLSTRVRLTGSIIPPDGWIPLPKTHRKEGGDKEAIDSQSSFYRQQQTQTYVLSMKTGLRSLEMLSLLPRTQTLDLLTPYESDI